MDPAMGFQGSTMLETLLTLCAVILPAPPQVPPVCRGRVIAVISIFLLTLIILIFIRAFLNPDPFHSSSAACLHFLFWVRLKIDINGLHGAVFLILHICSTKAC